MESQETGTLNVKLPFAEMYEDVEFEPLPAATQ
jgi:hypothetical protein